MENSIFFLWQHGCGGYGQCITGPHGVLIGVSATEATAEAMREEHINFDDAPYDDPENHYTIEEWPLNVE